MRVCNSKQTRDSGVFYEMIMLINVTSQQVALNLINGLQILSVLEVEINRDRMRVIAFTLKHTNSN